MDTQLSSTNLDPNSFAGFIITYERTEILRETIEAILDQTFPPSYLLVIDNGGTTRTEQLVASMSDARVAYHRMGYNAGPAGAAQEGLKLLAAKGYEWIYWGDDNDPPEFRDDFGKLLSLSAPDIGIVGAVGHRFNKTSGTMIRFPNELLKGTLQVDTIAGSDCMIVNAKVVKAGVLPDKDLFFGLEELDFCLRVKKAGFQILVDGDLYFKYRTHHNNLNKKVKFVNFKTAPNAPVREYYSKRNLLHICKRNFLMFAFINTILKILAKMVLGFRMGYRYGVRNMQLMALALAHGISGRLGKRHDLG